jgi:hypothetical protein
MRPGFLSGDLVLNNLAALSFQDQDADEKEKQLEIAALTASSLFIRVSYFYGQL